MEPVDLLYSRNAQPQMLPSLDARSWRQARSLLDELRKTIVEMRGPKKVLVLGGAHLGASGLGW